MVVNECRQWRAPYAPPDEDNAPDIKYERDVQYELLQREPGRSLRIAGPPLWRSAAGAINFSDSFGPVQRFDTPVPGAFVLSNVLTASECKQLRRLSEAMGYRVEPAMNADASGRPDRRNSSCVWIADESLWLPIWRRIAPHLPMDGDAGSALGLNHRWRFYRYEAGDDFGTRSHTRHGHPRAGCDWRCRGTGSGRSQLNRIAAASFRHPPLLLTPSAGMHVDGAWIGSGLDANGRFMRDQWRGQRLSRLTLLLYLTPLDACARRGVESTAQGTREPLGLPERSANNAQPATPIRQCPIAVPRPHQNRIRPSSTPVRPSSDPHQTLIRPASEPHQALIRPSSDPHQTLIRPSSDPHQTLIRPSSDPLGAGR